MPTMIQHWWVAELIKGMLPETLQTGFVWGHVIPDADIYPASAMILCLNEQTGINFHRSFSHSALGVLLVFLTLLMVGSADFACGFFLGHVFHVVLDFFFWFWFVDIWWPLRFWYHWARPVNLWSWMSRSTVEQTGYWLEMTDLVLYTLFFHMLGPQKSLILYYVGRIMALLWILVTHWMWKNLPRRYFFAYTHTVFMVIQFPLFVWLMLNGTGI